MTNNYIELTKIFSEDSKKKEYSDAINFVTTYTDSSTNTTSITYTTYSDLINVIKDNVNTYKINNVLVQPNYFKPNTISLS